VGADGMREFRQIDLDARRPAQHREQIGVGDGERVAHQVLLAGELLVEPVETLAEIFLGDLLVFVGRRRPEDRAVGFVQLRSDEVEPFLHPHALHAAGVQPPQVRCARLPDHRAADPDQNQEAREDPAA